MSEPETVLPDEPELDEAEENRLDAAAEADVAAGRIVPHAEAAKRVDSLGTDNELPRPMPKAR